MTSGTFCERTTAEIVAALRYDDGVSTPTFGDLADAADRLEALQAEVDSLRAISGRAGIT